MHIMYFRSCQSSWFFLYRGGVHLLVSVDRMYNTDGLDLFYMYEHAWECIFMCIFMFINTSARVYVPVCTSMNADTCRHTLNTHPHRDHAWTYQDIHMNTNTHTCVRTKSKIDWHVCINVHTKKYTTTFMHTHIAKHIHKRFGLHTVRILMPLCINWL